MPFSLGTFSRVYNWATEQLSSPIEIAKLDTQEADFATGLSNCILRDGTGLPTAAQNWNGQKLQGLANGTLAGDAAPLSQLQADAYRTLGSVAGTNTITGTLTPTLTAYTTGMMVKFTPANDTTSTVTINIDSLGAKAITKGDATPLDTGDLQASTTHVLVYDGTRFVVLNPCSFVVLTPNVSASEQGYKGVPQAIQNAYTFVLSDAGKSVLATTNATTITIPSNASVPFPVGTTLTIVANVATSISIAITTDTMSLAGTSFATTGTRTLATGGIATAYKFLATSWLISGSGLT